MTLEDLDVNVCSATPVVFGTAIFVWKFGCQTKICLFFILGSVCEKAHTQKVLQWFREKLSWFFKRFRDYFLFVLFLANFSNV